MVINELIREYLEFNKYKYTSSVMSAGTVVVIFIIYSYRLNLTKVWQTIMMY